MNLLSTIITAIMLLGALPLLSQVGINTRFPQGVLHVDAKGDTSGSVNQSDDVIVTKDGRLGIGVLTPTTKLHIVSPLKAKGFTLQDGTQAANYILVSDNNGNARWVESEVSEFELIPSVTSATISFTGNTYTYDPGLRVTFPKYGTYSLSILTRLVLNRTLSSNPHVKVLFTPVGSSNGFIGSSQILASPIASTIYHQAYINQNIEVNVSTGLVARIEYSISGQFIATSGTLSAMWSGTFIRVK